MENPLSEDQVKEINEIAKLSPDEQKSRLQDFLKTLTPEQIEFLKKQRVVGEQCPFCLIVEKKIPAKIVYEDGKVLAVLDINPANKGHVLVIPKTHYQFLSQMSDEDIGYIFKIANNLSKVILEVLKAEGINIFVADGEAAGQRAPHTLIHVIPRFSGDNINLIWEGKKLGEEEMSEVEKAIKEKITPLKIEEEAPKVEETSVEEEDYKEEERIP